MKIDVINDKKEVVSKFDVSILDLENIRYDLIHQLVVWQLAKRRSVISHTKEISEVSGSTRKIYKQKGTGRARHGSIRGAQFRGGGIIFGPNKDRNFSFKLNKKVKKIALKHALASKIKDGAIILHEELSFPVNKTKDFFKEYSKDKKNISLLFVDEVFNDNFLISSKNIHGVNNLPSMGLNVLDLMKYKEVHFSKKSFSNVLERFR
jgi:large subunit ribosomal protein L4